MSDDMFYARVCQERDALRAELEKLRCELDDAEERASEAEERCAAEWEKDCGHALRLLAQVTKFEWDQDGSPADEVREHIQITLQSLEKQVVTLRAELAAAKEEIQTWRLRHRDAMDTATRKVQQAEEVAAERDRIAADNARMRKALEAAFDGAARQLAEPRHHGNDQYALTAIATTCELALAAPPAQSLAAHDAALLREVMNLIRQTTPDPVDGVPESFGAHQGRMYAIEQIGAEADRIERDAAAAKESA